MEEIDIYLKSVLEKDAKLCVSILLCQLSRAIN